MKTIIIVLAVLFTMSISAPIFAQDHPAGSPCSAEKMEACKCRLEEMLKTLEILNTKVQKTLKEINKGRILTNEEADRLLKNTEKVYPMGPTTEGFMWDN